MAKSHTPKVFGTVKEFTLKTKAERKSANKIARKSRRANKINRRK